MNYLPALSNAFYSVAKTVWGADIMIILYEKGKSVVVFRDIGCRLASYMSLSAAHKTMS